MREIISMIVVLSCICGISGLALSYLKISTATLIEEQVLTYVQAPALEQVFPESSNDPLKDRQNFEIDGKQMAVFPVKQNGKLTGLAFETFSPGYGGDIGVLVGFNLENDRLAGIGITTMKETPGLGTRVADAKYTRQFTGGHPAEVQLSASGGSIDAVSGATISSAATIDAVNKAADIYAAHKDEFIKTFQTS